jgi:hypothetical protein
MKFSILWDITAFSQLKVNRRFGVIYRLHLQCRGTFYYYKSYHTTDTYCRESYFQYVVVDFAEICILGHISILFLYFLLCICQVSNILTLTKTAISDSLLQFSTFCMNYRVQDIFRNICLPRWSDLLHSSDTGEKMGVQ